MKKERVVDFAVGLLLGLSLFLGAGLYERINSSESSRFSFLENMEYIAQENIEVAETAQKEVKIEAVADLLVQNDDEMVSLSFVESR